MTITRRRRGPSKKVIREIDEMLRSRGAGKKCQRHPRRLVTLGIIWADGRAYTFACNRECYLNWEEKQGKWACVVRVIPINKEMA